MMDDWYMTPEGPKRFTALVPMTQCPHDTLEVTSQGEPGSLLHTYMCPMCHRAVGLQGQWMIRHSLEQIWDEVVKVFGERWRFYPLKFQSLQPGRVLDVRTGLYDTL